MKNISSSLPLAEPSLGAKPHIDGAATKPAPRPQADPNQVAPDPEHMNAMCETLRSLGMPFSASASQVDLNQALEFLVGIPAGDENEQTQAHCVQTLVDWGADINGANSNGETVLMRAIASDSSHVNLLVDLGAKVDAVDHQGRNAWHYVALHGQTAYDKLAKADPQHVLINTPDNGGRTPLWHGCQQTVLAKSVPALLQCGADIALQDQEGCNGWFHAVQSDCASTLLPLLAHHDKGGMALNAVNKRHESATHGLEEGPNKVFMQSCGGISHPEEALQAQKILAFGKRLDAQLTEDVGAYIKDHAALLTKLAQACGPSSADSSDYKTYGSDAGNRYFQNYTKLVMIPALADCFSYLRYQLPTLQAKNPDVSDALAMVAFNVILNKLGEMRQHIAQVTRSDDAADFGRPVFVASLRDPVDAYPGWMQLISGTFRSVMQEAYENLSASHTPENFLQELVDLNCTVIDGIKEIDGRLHFSLQLPSGPLSGIFVGRIELALKNTTTVDEDDLEQLFAPSAVASTGKDQAASTISIDCHHEALDAQSLYSLSQSLFDAVTWDDAQERSNLKKSLHDFLGQFYVTSLWQRGQASAAQIIVEALDELHGEDLVFPLDWQSSPNRQNLTTDLRFLSDFDDRETSFEKFDANVQFVKRRASNSSNNPSS